MLLIMITKNIAIALSTDWLSCGNGFAIVELGFGRDVVSAGILGMHIGINFNMAEHQEVLND